MATVSKPVTFAEFEKLPDNGMRRELRHGEIVEMPPLFHGHKVIERRLRRLDPAAGSAGVVELEVAFRLGEHEYRIADVALVWQKEWDSAPADGYLMRAPALVIEVLSPSNTVSEIRDKRKLCLENGSREFWVVDPEQREVEVSMTDGHSITYKSGDAIPLFFATGKTLAIKSVFEEET